MGDCCGGKCFVDAPSKSGTPSKVKPCGSQVLVELLTVQEKLNTKLTLLNNQKASSNDAFQAYVLAVGPSLEVEKWGFNLGDRVLLSGGAIPVPNLGKNEHREWVLLEPSSIKCVVKENLVELE